MKPIFVMLAIAAHLYTAPTEAATQQEAHTNTRETTIPVNTVLGHKIELQSAILGEKRDIFVRLPKSHDQDGKKFPVVYVLDGENHFEHASIGVGLLEENGRMPESIIVAIPNGVGTRGRDLARNQEAFRKFITEEVFTFIEKTYQTQDHRTLFGHSLAGYFTLKTMTDHRGMFDNYIAASPVVQARNSEVLAKLSKLFKDTPELQKSLYFTLTNIEEEGQAATEALDKMVLLLKNEAPASLAWHYEFIDNQVHMTTPFLTLYEGLTFSFSDYQAPRFASTADFKKAGGLTGLEDFFKARSEKYGTNAALPQGSVRQLGYLFRGEGKFEEALTLFKRNAETYPEQPRVYNSLGDGYDAAGQLTNAVAAYQNAVALALEQESGNAGFFQRQVQRLEQKIQENNGSEKE